MLRAKEVHGGCSVRSVRLTQIVCQPIPGGGLKV